MITIDIRGGLGNQLFQIFTLISYSYNNNLPYFFEDKDVLRDNKKLDYWNTIFKYLKDISTFKKLTNEKQILLKEAEFHYTPLQLPLPDESKEIHKLFGYYQSYKYFDMNKDYLFNLLNLETIKNEVKLKMLSSNIEIDYSNTVSLHFRVGDYAKLQEYHPLMPIQYYIKALETLIEDTGKNDWNVLYFFEKGDILYVNEQINMIKSNSRILDELLFIPFTENNNDSTIIIDDWEEMIIMSLCHHNIIANSTFSWWAAYMNKCKYNCDSNDTLIYYPAKWFGYRIGNVKMDDLFQEKWKKICF
uniref:Alpha-1,2-fucosyltransferase n=1 Tax=viral metagenome TaxID=1070528 RepID=A0A6C0F0C6_9ZZZZ